MGDGLTKVCPNCGEQTFYADESVRQTVIIEGDGSTVDRYEVLSSKRDEGIRCVSCHITIDTLDSLVTESYFHEVIVPKSMA